MGAITVTEDRPTVVVIDDEPDLADLYATWLTDGYDVRTAYGGEEGVDRVDEDVDVVLIDRLMPDLSGDEVLEYIREAGYDCRVAMVTAVEPDFDIIEMGFDDYLVKPVQREDLQSAVSSLVTQAAYDDQLREFFALVSKRSALESKKSARELDGDERYAELTDRIEDLHEALDQTVADFDDADFEAALYRLED